MLKLYCTTAEPQNQNQIITPLIAIGATYILSFVYYALEYNFFGFLFFLNLKVKILMESSSEICPHSLIIILCNTCFLYFVRSLTFKQLDQYHSAIEDANKTIELNPNWFKVFITRSIWVTLTMPIVYWDVLFLCCY